MIILCVCVKGEHLNASMKQKAEDNTIRVYRQMGKNCHLIASVTTELSEGLVFGLMTVLSCQLSVLHASG